MCRLETVRSGATVWKFRMFDRSAGRLCDFGECVYTIEEFKER